MTEKVKKPHLAEIFAAFSGIGYAAMGALSNPKNNLSHPLCQLEEKASNLRYTLRQDILDNIRKPDQADRQEKVATKALAFLRIARDTLDDHADIQLVGADPAVKGGFAHNVIDDINDLLVRNVIAADRPLVHTNDGGEILPRVRKDYFPATQKTGKDGEKTQPASGLSVSDDQKIRQSAGRRNKQDKSAVLQPV